MYRYYFHAPGFRSSYVGSSANPLPTITTVNNAIKQWDSYQQPVPIPVLIGQYDTVKSNAFSGNLPLLQECFVLQQALLC